MSKPTRKPGAEGKLGGAALDALADAVITAWKAGMRVQDLPTAAPLVLVIEPGALEGLPERPEDLPPWAEEAEGSPGPGSVIVSLPLDCTGGGSR